MRTLIGAVVLGGIIWLARKRSGVDRLVAPLTPQGSEVRLVPLLDGALAAGDRPRWEDAVNACQKAGKPDLPGHRLRTFTPLAEALYRG